MKLSIFSQSRIWILALTLCGAMVPFAASADEETEIVRLGGFAEHQSSETKFERLRRRGETEYLEEAEQWEREKDRNLAEYKKQKAAGIKKQSEDGADAKVDTKAKQDWERDYDKSRQDYAKKQRSFDRTKHKELVTENEELDLTAQRPRYDYKKRALYGAPLKYGKAGSMPRASGSSSGFSPPSPSTAPFGSNPNFPPPQYDDFGDGYIPPPTLGDGFGDDLPPPPPPPVAPIEDFGNSDMMIPPPPPPPPFMDESGEF